MKTAEFNFFFYYNGARVYLKHYGNKFVRVTLAKSAAGKFTKEDLTILLNKKLVLKDRVEPIFWSYELC